VRMRDDGRGSRFDWLDVLDGALKVLWLLAWLLVGGMEASARGQTPDSLAVTACASEGCGTAWMHLATPLAASLYDDYSPVGSPHWSHIRTMVTDFYYNWTPTERAWAAAHYDAEMSGDASAWQGLNPTVQTYPYTLLWTTLIPSATAMPNITGTYYADMQSWYAAHPAYRIETAFVHDSGAAADSARRKRIAIWGSARWVVNPADSGLVAYDVDRYRRIVASASGGAFIDESASGDIAKGQPSAEYPAQAAYMTAYAALLARLHQSIAPKILMPNTGGYFTDADLADVTAAGGTHLEKVNNPLHSGLPGFWSWIEQYLAGGAVVDLVNAFDFADDSVLAARGTYPGGNEPTTFAREKMAELASYYLVVPATPDHLALQLVNMWDRPFSNIWLKAQEADIGHPTAARAVQTLATKDSAGQPIVLYQRDFTRALVIFRVQTGWGAQSYADSTAVTIPLAAGETWLPLHADGSLGAAVTALPLRNSEAAILIKASALP